LKSTFRFVKRIPELGIIHVGTMVIDITSKRNLAINKISPKSNDSQYCDGCREKPMPRSRAQDLLEVNAEQQRLGHEG
jgi:hypothetical protein